VNSEDFETFIKSQLKTLQAQIETLRNYLNEYEDRNRKLKRLMSEELISALLFRFEKNEERISKIDEKLDSIHFNINEKLSQEIRNIKNEVSDANLTRSISKLLGEKEIKVESKILEELKEDYNTL
jgi:hypothetical protein